MIKGIFSVVEMHTMCRNRIEQGYLIGLLQKDLTLGLSG